MITGFHDHTGGGFLLTLLEAAQFWARSPPSARRFRTRRLRLEIPATAIALLRLHAYTNDGRYRDIAEDTLEVFAGIAEHYGLFAATYGIALDTYLQSHTQVVIAGSGEQASACARWRR